MCKAQMKSVRAALVLLLVAWDTTVTVLGFLPQSPLRSSSHVSRPPLIKQEGICTLHRTRAARPAIDLLRLQAGKIEWTSTGKQIRANGDRVDIKGVNWFGFEGSNRCPGGIRWSDGNRYLGDILGFLSAERFNAIRFPISLDMALDLYSRPQAYDLLCDSDLRGLNTARLLEAIIERAAGLGILVIIDMHKCSEYNPDPADEFWYDPYSTQQDKYTYFKLLDGWRNVLNIAQKHWNVFAIDLKNEPHGQSEWGTGKADKDWKKAAEAMTNTLLSEYPEFKGLVFVEGIQKSQDGTYGNWGGNFKDVNQHPLDTGNPDFNRRLVYSPHVYGPAMPPKDASYYDYGLFDSPSFPGNLDDFWSARWGNINQDNAVVIGEWGGWCNNYNAESREHTYDNRISKDFDWHKQLAKYLVSKDQRSNFYWCLNPNSKDTGGILQWDWKSPVQNKIDIINSVVDKPSRFEADGSLAGH